MKQPVDPRRIEVVDDRVAEILRRKTPAERVAMVISAHDLMRKLMESSLRQRYPHWPGEDIRAEVARRMLGDPGTIAAPRRQRA